MDSLKHRNTPRDHSLINTTHDVKVKTGKKRKSFFALFVLLAVIFFVLLRFSGGTEDDNEDAPTGFIGVREDVGGGGHTVTKEEKHILKKISNMDTENIEKWLGIGVTEAEEKKGELLRKELIEVIPKASSLSLLEDLVIQFNTRVPLLNRRKFAGQVDPETAIPIILVVHSRTSYLEYTIKMLKSNPNISSTLLIVSHDGLFPEVLEMIASIDFCMVKQIIFPYHVEWMRRLESYEKVGLISKKNPGQLKLHWMFIQTTAWERLPVRFNEVCYMEDDFWVTPDFYNSLHALKRMRDKFCPDCFGSVAGRHWWDPIPGSNVIKNADKVSFVCPRNSMSGLSLSRESWQHFHSHAFDFCTIKSAHWDDPIHLMMCNDDRILQPLLLEATFPRTLHVGKCGGIHFNLQDADACDIEANYKKFQRQLTHKLEASANYLKDTFSFSEVGVAEAKQRAHRECQRKFQGFVGGQPRDHIPFNYKTTCLKLSVPKFSGIDTQHPALSLVPLEPDEPY